MHAKAEEGNYKIQIRDYRGGGNPFPCNHGDNVCKYRIRQRGCSLTHSARTPPDVHQGITIWVDKIEFEKK